MDNQNKREEGLGGSLYDFVVLTISRDCLVDTVSGEKFISHAELRRSLGFKCRIPYKFQMKVISELLDKQYLIISKIPSCAIIHVGSADIFYKINKEED
jgi:hypothetical protein